MPDPDIDVAGVNGHVTIEGVGPDWRTRNAAYYAARDTLGVVGVVDNLVVGPR